MRVNRHPRAWAALRLLRALARHRKVATAPLDSSWSSPYGTVNGLVCNTHRFTGYTPIHIRTEEFAGMTLNWYFETASRS